MAHTSTVYLLHLEPPYRHAGHYLGSTAQPVTSRIADHCQGRGSPLVAAAVAAGCAIRLVRTWPGGRTLERRLKARKDSDMLCPCCRTRRGLTPHERPIH